MKIWTKAILCFSLSFMCIFTCFGYAATSGHLNISGEVTVEPAEPEGLYISDVSIYSTSNATATKSAIVLPTSLNATVSANGRNCSVTYKITVYNKTDITYWYVGTKILEDVENNALFYDQNGISVLTKDNYTLNSSPFDTNDWIPPQTYRDFYVTYTFGSDAQGTITTLVNFAFGINISSVSDEFLRVLNDKTSAYGYYYLSGEFNDKYANEKSTILGNIGDDKEVFDNLFGENLTINIDGNNVPVTILVERKNMDKDATTGDSYNTSGAPSGCEYTVYITVDNLEPPNTSATVYAISYSCGPDGTWYKIGELYEGTTNITNYDSAGNEAFSTTNWVATNKEYRVTNDISYIVGSKNTGTTAQMLFKLEDLLSVKDSDFYNMINNNSSKLLVPVCRIIYTYTHRPDGKYDEKNNVFNMNKNGYAALEAAFLKIKPHCLIENGAQNVRLENVNSFTRAEIIPLLEEIQAAYDYYLAVNPNG